MLKIIAHPYTHNFPIFKHPAGVEPAPPVWKTGVISIKPRMHIYQHRHTGSRHTDGLCLKIRVYRYSLTCRRFLRPHPTTSDASHTCILAGDLRRNLLPCRSLYWSRISFALNQFLPARTTVSFRSGLASAYRIFLAKVFVFFALLQRAGKGIRTLNLSITSRLRCQLRHTGKY